jgi:hypothetical protein
MQNPPIIPQIPIPNDKSAFAPLEMLSELVSAQL